MLYGEDKIVKLGGIKIPGQIKSIDITSTATIDDIQDDKGNTKKTQPTGYESSKISIEITLEDTKHKTTLDQIKDIQRLFKSTNQKKAKLLKIVNEDCASRGISTVYFKSFTTKKVISESKRTASLELTAPMIAKITIMKKNNQKVMSNSKRIKQLKHTKLKTIKLTSRSPARDNVSTKVYLKQARILAK